MYRQYSSQAAKPHIALHLRKSHYEPYIYFIENITSAVESGFDTNDTDESVHPLIYV